MGFYIDANGRNSTLWPDWTWRFRPIAKRSAGRAYRMAGRDGTEVAR